MSFNKITPDKKCRAIELRMEGKSYRQIQKELDLKSKGTLSSWFKHIKLPQTSIKKLEKNIEKTTKNGFLKFNTERCRRIKKENNEAILNGLKLVDKLNKRELMLIGASLYWGEGTKESKKKNQTQLAFTNSDPKMVMVFIRFVREILEVPEEKIRSGIYLYPGISESEARQFWSSVTGLPKDRFYIMRFVSKASKGKRQQNRLPHGTNIIKVSKRTIFYKVVGMIEGIAQNK